MPVEHGQHLRQAGQHPEQRYLQEQEGGAEQHRRGRAPQPAAAHHAVEAGGISGTSPVPCEAFDGVGKAIQSVGRQQQQLHQQGVGGQGCRSQFLPHAGKKGEGCKQGNRAHEQVAVAAHQREVGARVQQLGQVGGQWRGAPKHSEYGQAEAEVFSDHGSRCGAIAGQAEPNHQHDVQHDIGQIGRDQYPHRPARVTMPDKPPDDGVGQQYRRCADDADTRVAVGQCQQCGVWRHQHQSGV